MDGFVDRSMRRRLDCVPGELPYSLLSWRRAPLPYLIDGNNLLGSWGGPQEGDDRRHEVVRRVAAFCRGRNARATVVFDGHPLRDDLAAQELGPVSVRVPPPGTDADSLIRELVERAARPSGLYRLGSSPASRSRRTISSCPCCAASASARCRLWASAVVSIRAASAGRPNPAAAAMLSTRAPRRASASAARAYPKARAVISGDVHLAEPRPSTAAPKSSRVSTSATWTPAFAG